MANLNYKCGGCTYAEKGERYFVICKCPDKAERMYPRSGKCCSLYCKREVPLYEEKDFTKNQRKSVKNRVIDKVRRLKRYRMQDGRVLVELAKVEEVICGREDIRTPDR